MVMSGFLREEDLCSTLKREIVPLIRQEDFEDMYKEGGRPPLSPKVLLMVTVFQFLEGLSDRAAAFSLRYRIDWKIALGLELEDGGVHHSSLSRFRDRLLEHDKASYALDMILDHLVQIKLVKKNGKQRIDSTHVIAKVRELSRLELLQETLRLFCEDALSYRPECSSIVSDALNRYQDQKSVYQMTDETKASRIREAGLAMCALIEWVDGSKSLEDLRAKTSFETLKKVFQQNFTETPDGDYPELIKIATGKDHICSPHEVDARYGNKGKKGWIGFKAQIAETVPEKSDDDRIIPNFITYAEINDATDHDGNSILDYVNTQQVNGIEPSKVYADTHYNTEANIKDLSLMGIDLRGPVVPMPEQDRTKEENIGFEVDLEHQSVTCSEGKTSIRFAPRAQNKISATFSQKDCRPCKDAGRCKPAPRGKNILIKLESPILSGRRIEMQTDAFKREMHQRNGIEGTLSGLVRGQQLRNCRYRGKKKARLATKFAAASANIKRLHRFYEILRAA
jgi:transposase